MISIISANSAKNQYSNTMPICDPYSPETLKFLSGVILPWMDTRVYGVFDR